MSSKGGGGGGSGSIGGASNLSVPLKCQLNLRHCLAITLRKEGCLADPAELWMYDSGYLLFQGLLAANSVCWWNGALSGAARVLRFRGYVAPGTILVTADPCALEVIRNAWARRLLKPPAGYVITSLGDLEECMITTIPQGQWTPLPEAVCEVVLQLTTEGRPAAQPAIRARLREAFPHVQQPPEPLLYDTLAQLEQERKIYHTSRGYFIVTPERRRSRSHSRGRRRQDHGEHNGSVGPASGKGILMSTEEALVLVHGEMATIRDGDITHQCIQTNLADVICGGTAGDKILYPGPWKRRSASFPAPRSLERRGSFRLWGGNSNSNRRLRRSASTRTLARHNLHQNTDTSSSTEHTSSTDSQQTSPKKGSLLSRLFRRSKRSHNHIKSFSAQFPPTEWFNSKAIHLHSIGTQTTGIEQEKVPHYYENHEIISSRSATLPRRHRRQPSNESACGTSFGGSREHSPSLRHRSPASTLPRNGSNLLKVPRNSSRLTTDPGSVSQSSRKTSRSSLATKTGEIFSEEKVETEKVKASHQSLDSKIEGSLKSSLDNSGPSSIDSQSTKTLSSQNTSGPSSLESHRTVIARQNSGPSSFDSQSTLTELKANRKSPKLVSKRKEKIPLVPQKPKLANSNSFTLQVTTNQNGVAQANSTTTATINSGSSTKIFVQNSPVRSVITFENGQTDPNVVIINGNGSSNLENSKLEKEIPEKVVPDGKIDENLRKNQKNANNDTATENLNNSKDSQTCSNLPNPSLENQNIEMNNIRKLSLQLPKENLSYKNFLKNVPSSSCNQFVSNSNPGSPIINSFREFTKNTFSSNPPTPTKSFDNIPNPFGLEKFPNSKTSLDKLEKSDLYYSNKIVEKNTLGSEPNLKIAEIQIPSKSLRDSNRDSSEYQFPSLSDLSFNFTSLAAQKILKGVSINSIDTLVELNMAANGEKQNNCDVVHTDFGLV